MKRYLLLTLIALFFVSDIVLSAVIKETKQGQSIEFFTNETGTVEKKAEITSAGKLKVKEVTDLAGTGTPPGMVPIGGMVAVMPNTHANTWQPPATGIIKDGFMRANGHVVTAQNVIDGSLIPEGVALPDMVNRFIRGATTSGGLGGSDSITPSGTVSQPTFAGSAESRSAWFKSQGISATIPGHYHSMSGDGTTLDVGALGTTNVALSKTGGVSPHDFGTGNYTVTGSVSRSGNSDVSASNATQSFTSNTTGSHSHGIDDPGFGTPGANNISVSAGTTGYYTRGANTLVIGADGNHSHSWTQSISVSGSASGGTWSFTNGAVSATNFDHSHIDTIGGTTNIAHDHGLTGSIGNVTSTNNGDDGSLSIDFNENNDNMQEWSAAGDYTPSGTVSQPSFSGNALDNKPAYTTVVWVIRVM